MRKGMTTVENDILQALIDLDNAVKQMRTANPKPNLRPVFERIDALAAKLPRETDPNLRHYLNKKSYEKALLFLQGRDVKN